MNSRNSEQRGQVVIVVGSEPRPCLRGNDVVDERQIPDSTRRGIA